MEHRPRTRVRAAENPVPAGLLVALAGLLVLISIVVLIVPR
jgi:hypothetical protein